MIKSLLSFLFCPPLGELAACKRELHLEYNMDKSTVATVPTLQKIIPLFSLSASFLSLGMSGHKIFFGHSGRPRRETILPIFGLAARVRTSMGQAIVSRFEEAEREGREALFYFRIQKEGCCPL